MTAAAGRDRPLLVVGRKGQLATNLAEAGRVAGTALTALGRPELDLTDADGVARTLHALQPRAIVNAAAYTQVDKAESEPEAAFALNRDGPAALARWCADAGVPLIHVSTDQVFGDDRERAHREDDAPNPMCLYGRSKLAGEEAVLASGAKALIVRVSWVFGPSGDNFVTKVLGWAQARDALTIVDDQRGRPTYSPALAAALIGLAQRMAEGDGTAPSGLLHLAGDDVMTRDAQARAILDGSRRRGGPFAQVTGIATRDFPTPAKRPLNAVLDVNHAQSLGLALGIDLALGPFLPALEATLDRLIGPARGDGA